MITSVGIDLGSSKTVIVDDSADLIRTDTGGISRPTLVAFSGRSRLTDEAAAAQTSSQSMLRHLNMLIGQDQVVDLEKSILYRHRKATLGNDEKGRTTMFVDYNDEPQDIGITSLLGMFLAKQDDRISRVYTEENNTQLAKLSFVLPPNATANSARTIKQACQIAGVDLSRVCTVDKLECLKIAYTRKVHGLREPEQKFLENKKVVVIEMGHTQTTAMLLQTGSMDPKKTPLFHADGPTVVKHAYDSELGALHFDLAIFDHFASICEKKHQTEITPGSKRGQRLINGCERIRKLLSQLPTSGVMVENLTDNGDVNFTLNREELATLGSGLLDRLNSLLKDLLHGMTAQEIAEVGAVEVLGGGVRMPIVQKVICELFKECKAINNVTGPGAVAGDDITASKALGAKMDDGSVALGAALISTDMLTGDSKETRAGGSIFITHADMADAGSAANIAEGVIGYDDAEMAELVELEKKMQEQDAEIEQLLAARNDLEAYILDCRGFPRQKYGTAEYIDLAGLDTLLNDVENWTYDNYDANLKDTVAKFEDLKSKVTGTLCKKYFEKLDEDKKEAEAQMEVEAQKAAAEKEANGEDDQDVDNRKLKKADRMRLVVKNKEEGTEIFKGGVYRTAAARYHKALTHASKFFDLTPEDEKEVKALKISLYLNLAQCYLKMAQPDQALNNCNFALELDPRNPKAFFRRSAAYEAKKDIERAMEDAKTAQGECVVPDKAINQTVGRLKKELEKIKSKEKAMWGKAFQGK